MRRFRNRRPPAKKPLPLARHLQLGAHGAAVPPDDLSLQVRAEEAIRPLGLALPAAGALVPDVAAEGGTLAAKGATRCHRACSSLLHRLAPLERGKLEFG